MRCCRNFKTNRCYHLISRIAHRAFFLDDGEKTRLVERGSDKVAFDLLRLLSEGEMRPADLRERLGVASRSYFTLRYLSPLVASGYVEMTGPSHPRSSAQAYRLSARGRKVVA